jgi:hypothetical protein
MTKKKCPLGEDCDLTTAWMAGRNYTIHRYREEANPIIEAKDAEIERLQAKLKRGLSMAKGIEMACLGLRDEAQPLTAKDAARKMIAALTGGKDERS